VTPDDRSLRGFLWKVFLGASVLLAASVGLMLTRWRAPAPAVEVPAAPIGAAAAALRAQEEAILASVAWRDRARGRVAIPIERAMDRVREDGLPSRRNVR
jgi:hypothetical protein